MLLDVNGVRRTKVRGSRDKEDVLGNGEEVFARTAIANRWLGPHCHWCELLKCNHKPLMESECGYFYTYYALIILGEAWLNYFN